MAAEQKLDEEAAMNEIDNASALNLPDQETEENQDSLDPPDQETEKNQDVDKEQQRGPVHERGVHGEINAICGPLDISEVYFSADHPYELQPLSKYFMHEWSEAEHLFKSAMDFAEEMFSDWSPCPSPSPVNIGL